jgi:hypothetical protein
LEVQVKNQKMFMLIIIIVLISVLLSACGKANPMEDVPREETGKVRGFWGGLWDGMTAGFTLIGNIFGGNWGVYEVHNNGNWYNFGFLLGSGALASSGSSASRRRRR